MKRVDLWKDVEEIFKAKKHHMMILASIILGSVFIFAVVPLGIRFSILLLQKGLAGLLGETEFLRLFGVVYFVFFLLLYLLFFKLRKTPFPKKECIGYKSRHSLLVDYQYIRRGRENVECVASFRLDDYKNVVLLRSNLENPLISLPVERENICLTAKIPSMKDLKYEIYEVGAIGEGIKIEKITIGDVEKPYGVVYADERGNLLLKVLLNDARSLRVKVEGKEVARFTSPGKYRLEIVDRTEEDVTIELPDLTKLSNGLVKFGCADVLSLTRRLIKKIVEQPRIGLIAINTFIKVEVIVDKPFMPDEKRVFYVKPVLEARKA